MKKNIVEITRALNLSPIAQDTRTIGETAARIMMAAIREEKQLTTGVIRRQHCQHRGWHLCH